MQIVHPNLIVMEISINDIDGIELIRHFTRMLPQAPILVFSALDPREYAARACHAGARGFLPKTASREQLLETMRAILRGIPDIPIPGRNAAHPTRTIKPHLEPVLSDREIELFRFLGKGYPTRKIAEVMQLSEHTVNAYRLHIKQKLHLEDFSQLIQQAVIWEDHQY